MLIKEIKSFLIALQFLTILPIKIKSQIKESDFGGSLVYFPLAGVLLGVFSAFTLYIFGFMPQLVTAAIILIVSVVMTGGLHLDGFADTCDGLYGFKNKERTLEIMRDSHIGVMGAIALVLLLFMKFALLASIPYQQLWKLLILSAIFARWAQVLACFLTEYARSEGKAKYFIVHAGRKEIVIGTLFTIFIFILLMNTGGAILFFVSMLPVLLFINYVKKKISGMTGDTIGAASEIAEVCALFFGLILTRITA